MNKKYVAKRSSEDAGVTISTCSDTWESSCEGYFPRRYNKNRVILGIVLICIIGIAGGCSSSEMQQSEKNPVNLESSEIDGQWVGVVDGMDGKPLELNYRFRAEGNRLLGLIESRLGGGPISDGKIDGKNIEFTLNAGDVVILNNGILSGEEIQLTETIDKEKIKVVLKRVKR
jgi:hypothetical protein